MVWLATPFVRVSPLTGSYPVHFVPNNTKWTTGANQIRDVVSVPYLSLSAYIVLALAALCVTVKRHLSLL